MNVSQIIEILEKRVVYLQTLKTAAYAEGDLDAYNRYEMEISETETSLTILRPHI
jgi:hypothetical protein